MMILCVLSCDKRHIVVACVTVSFKLHESRQDAKRDENISNTLAGD